MHPAPSIILFTVLSGLGFGLIAWLGAGAGPRGGWPALSLCVLALAMPSAGLLASVFHLGQPRRFLKAFSQWRTAWLSREAILALATLGAFGLYAASWLAGLRLAPLGALAATLAVATVLATAMIYAQMKSVPRWRSPLTPALFLLFAAAGGALAAGHASAPWWLAALGLAQAAEWLRGGRSLARSGTTLATATGLGPLGRLRLLEPPHTGPNYLLREMVYVVGRRHACRLRVAGLALACVLPLALVALAPAHPLAFGLGAVLHLGGALVLRWLFFAEAEHVVGLYYGRR